MSHQFDQLNDSWENEVQDRILEAEAKQAIANANFNAFYSASEVSLEEAHARIADLTSSGGT